MNIDNWKYSPKESMRMYCRMLPYWICPAGWVSLRSTFICVPDFRAFSCVCDSVKPIVVVVVVVVVSAAHFALVEVWLDAGCRSN